MHVKELLGHKRLTSTQIYIHLEEKLFQQLKNEFTVRRTVSIKGMTTLAAVSFEKFDEVDGVHLYRKPRPGEETFSFAQEHRVSSERVQGGDNKASPQTPSFFCCLGGVVLRQHRKSQVDSTLVTLTKRRFAIELKRNNPHLNLRQIADLAGANYGYARHVWAAYVRKEVTKKGSLSSGIPFQVHGWFFRDRLRSREYGLCPVRPCNRRNGQKVWHGCRVVYLIHKGGDVLVYPLFDGWDRELKT